MCQSTSVCLSVCLVLSRKFDRSQKLISLSIRRYLVDWIISSAVFCADQRCCACILADIRLSPVHTSNNVEATFDFVKATLDFVAKNGNKVERAFREISSFRQGRNKLNMLICYDFVERTTFRSTLL